jgi:iron complex transport system ATP-binding protein
MLVSVRDLCVTIDGAPILRRVSLDVGEGERWAIIGPNGAGKSTLIRCVAALQQLTSGDITVRGKDLRRYSAKALASEVGYVPQAHGLAIPYRVFDYVLMGRYPYQGFYALPTPRDREVVRHALEVTDTLEFAERSMDTLSGGELQRVLIAGAVSQESAVLLLDEPTTYLDPLHQELILRAIERVHREANRTIITVTHDINAALSRFSHILALKGGEVAFAGMTADLRGQAIGVLGRLFGIGFEELHASGGDRVLIVPEVAQ